MNEIDLAALKDIGRLPTEIESGDEVTVRDAEAMLRLDYTINGSLLVESGGQLVAMSYVELGDGGETVLEDDAALRFQQ